MQLTIENINPNKQVNRYSSKFAPIYHAIDGALNDRRELVLSGFLTFKDAWSVYKSIRRYYRDQAYISFSKYAAFRDVQPTITISPRGA